MLLTMKYCTITYKSWLTLRPSTKGNCDCSFEFVIRGKYDSKPSKCPDTSECVSGNIKILLDVVSTVKSVMQRIV